MTKIDELLKANAPAGIPSKRKLNATRDPSELYKSAKLSASNTGTSRTPRSLDGEPTDAVGSEDAGSAGADVVPDDDDDEGRFFGGGISKFEADVLDYVDGQDKDEDGAAPERIDLSWLKKAAQSLHRRIAQNSELRAKFADDPQRFISSEANLDTEIKTLSILSEHPTLYPDFVRLGCAADLVGLLSHDNTDIAIDAVEILGELTDDDAAADEKQWNVLVDALLEADCVDLLVSNFLRLDETDESDRNGVYYGLGILENLSSRASTCTQLGQHTRLLKWLLERAQVPEESVSQNKQYAAEILAIFAQTSPDNCRKLIEMDAIDVLLQLVALYRKRDPEKGTHEEEYMENLFEALTCLVDLSEGKAKFIEAEGVELCLIMLKGGKMSKQPTLRLLDHAMAGASGGHMCQKLVEEGGLKVTFTMFMKKDDSRTVQHLLAIFASMLRLLPSNSAERIRTLAKFVENDYEKITKLLRHRDYYASKVQKEERRIEEERKGRQNDDHEQEEDEAESIVRRMDAGLFVLQIINVILAWLCIEDDGARQKIRETMKNQGVDFESIPASLREQLQGLDTEEEEESMEMREMLTALGECLCGV